MFLIVDVSSQEISSIQIHGGNKCFIYTCVIEVLRSLRNSISSGLLAINTKLKTKTKQNRKKKTQSNLTVLSGSKG